MMIVTSEDDDGNYFYYDDIDIAGITPDDEDGMVTVGGERHTFS